MIFIPRRCIRHTQILIHSLTESRNRVETAAYTVNTTETYIITILLILIPIYKVGTYDIYLPTRPGFDTLQKNKIRQTLFR